MGNILMPAIISLWKSWDVSDMLLKHNPQMATLSTWIQAYL